jgi:hypothetical protein
VVSDGFCRCSFWRRSFGKITHFFDLIGRMKPVIPYRFAQETAIAFILAFRRDYGAGLMICRRRLLDARQLTVAVVTLTCLSCALPSSGHAERKGKPGFGGHCVRQSLGVVALRPE